MAVKRRGRWPLALLCAVTATRAAAQSEERDFCADRPGLGTPTCTLDPGRVQVELGLGDWTRDSSATERRTEFIAGDLLVRIGVGPATEAQIGWTAYGRTRLRDSLTGTVSRDDGTGDVLLAIRHNLLSPDGSGTTVAVQPFVTLPTGGNAIGAGDWGAGVLVPFGFELSDRASLAFTASAEAAVDEDGGGRHLAVGGVAGISVDLSDALNATLEIAATHDDDPAGASTPILSGVSFGWQPGENWQIDGGANLGFNRSAADLQLYFGISRRF
jgi:hypothetical protein